MRIIINDFGGYPFPIQLSRHLAELGHEVFHVFVSNIKTPHGDMNYHKDSKKMTIHPIVLTTEFKKYSFLGRYRGENEYAQKVSKIIESYKPDIFVSANTPLLAQSILLNKCKYLDIPFVYWCQDLHSIALGNYLYKRLSFLGKWVGHYFKQKEIRLLEQSDHIITISDGFNQIFQQWGISQQNISVIENWGPLSEINVEPKINKWSKAHGIDSKLVVLYSGTLGLKHNPLLISKAAEYHKGNGVIFLVISEGIGAEMLKHQKNLFKIDNLLILPYQDYSLLPEVLGSADILLSILEKEAALFSVPSKVLTYLCAQKAIILSVPKNNLSAKIVSKSNSGYCVEPDDNETFLKKIEELTQNPKLRAEMGKNGREYAENHFKISIIANKFMEVFHQVVS